MKFHTNASDLIRKRFSCRTYTKTPISNEDYSELQGSISPRQIGPLGNTIRFQLAAAKHTDSRELKRLGTYGFIKDPAGFLIGSSADRPGALEDFGYLAELFVLKATELGIGTCWLGGTFTRSRFSRIMSLETDEIIPSVISIGYPSDQKAWIDRISRTFSAGNNRYPFDKLFFHNSVDKPLTTEAAGVFTLPLEMVRLAPSASNKQPWRVIKQGDLWHFYIQRTQNYPSPVFGFLLGLADLQRIDLGIAMAHFELTANEHDLKGRWIDQNPNLDVSNAFLEYNITWHVS